MNNFTLEFTLRQHTPLIHFQADQPGATLRATELKPKLDRFLREKAPDLPFRAHHGDRHSLDYRLTVRYEGKNIKDYPKPFVKKGTKGYPSPYFADGVSIDQPQPTHLRFTSFHPEILEAIERHLPYLLAFENFGTRQSKGFGCYHFENTTKESFERLLSEHRYPVYKLDRGAKDGKDALNIINEFYKLLKSGINYPHKSDYRKSLLFEHMCDHRTGWEKRKLKKVFPQIVHGEHAPIDCAPEPKEYRYIRAMLGLAELYEYRPDKRGKKIKITSVEQEGSSSRYQRMRSPLTFKVFGGQIYLLQDRFYEGLCNKKFRFCLDGDSVDIPTPTSFDLNAFLRFVAQKGHIKPLKKGAQ